MQFTDLWVFIALLVICSIGIGVFLIGYMGTNYTVKDEENQTQLMQAYTYLYDEEEIDNENNWKAELPAYMSNYYKEIERGIKDLYFNSLIITIITAAVFAVLIATWLTPYGTFWGFLISYIWGSLIACVLAYFIYAIKIGTLFKIPIKAGASKEDLLKWIYGNGFMIAILIASLITLNFFFVTLVMKALAIIKISPIHYAIEILGFPTGILISSLYFREALSVTGRGVVAACDLMIKKDQYFGQIGNGLSYTTKVAAIMSNVIADVNYFDSILAISLFVSAPQIVMIHAEDYTVKDNFLGNMFGIILIFIFSWVGSLLISFFINSLKNDDAVSYTASNIRLQILLSTIVSIMLLFGFFFATPDKFEFGYKEHPYIYREAIYKPQIIGAAFLGIVLSVIILIYSEYLTSLGYSPVLNIVKQTKIAPTLNILNAYYLGWMGQLLPAIIIGIGLFGAYRLCVLVGFLALSCGFIMNMLILMPIQFLGSLSHDGLKGAYLAQFSHSIIDRLYSIAWASRNYTVWLKITNSIILTIFGMTLVGCSIYHSQTFILLLNGYNLFGLMIGVGLYQYNKGLTLYIVKVICEEALFDEKIKQAQKSKESEEQALIDFHYEYFPLKNRTANYYVTVNIGTCLIAVIATGVLFGHGACIALCIGYLVCVAITNISSVIIGSALKSAFIYSSYDENLQENSQVLATNLYGDIQGVTIEESTNHPQSYYMIFVMIISLMGIELFMNN